MKKINIKLLLVVNIFNLLILGAVLLLVLLDMNIGAVIGAVVWVIVTVYTNYTIAVKNTDMIEMIRSADKKHIFKKETVSLISAYKSIKLNEEFFSDMDSGGTMKEAYDLIAEQVKGNLYSAVKYMRSYNYITRPPYTFLTDICNQNDKLVESLTKLVELTLTIDSTADDVDLSFVDNLIISLKELTERKDR